MNYKNNEINVFLKLGTGLGIISIILIIWLFIAKIDVIAQTTGKIIPEGKNQTIAVLETSSIEKVLVKEGEFVKKGQQVALLDNTNTNANYKQVSDELALAVLRHRGIEAQLLDKQFSKMEGDEPDKFNQIQLELNSKYLSYQSNISALQAEQSQVANELISSHSTVAKLEKGKESWHNQRKTYEAIRDSNFISRLEADEKIREAHEKIDDIKIQKQLLSVSDAKLKQAKFKLQLAKNDYKQELFKEKTELEQKILSLKQEEIKSKHNMNVRILTSPIDGIVKEISTNSPTAVVTEGNVLMTIVPQDNLLKAEVLLKNTDIGYIEVGQTVKLKIETYAFQKYGLIEGKIEKISPDSIEDKESKQNFYHVIVSIPKNYLEKDNKKYYVKTGMTVNADIVIAERSIFEYLTSPLQKTILETAHER